MISSQTNDHNCLTFFSSKIFLRLVPMKQLLTDFVTTTSPLIGAHSGLKENPLAFL
jgi:hypothetical protein